MRAATGKGNTNTRYKVHGDGVASLTVSGFDVLAMPEHRRAEATAIVKEIIETNEIRDFKWYRTGGKDELCCYWGDHPMNTMWVTANNVHVLADTSLVRRPPSRRITWKDQQGVCIGWLLPGADQGSGGARRNARMDEIVCPETFLRQPAGSVCEECEIVRS
ncbi:MAG: hypothetical protein ACRD2C_13650 [Acidimicrobiales bacterium]